MVTAGQPPTMPQPAPPAPKSSPWAGIAIGCLALTVVVLLAGVATGLVVWRPWDKHGPDRPPTTGAADAGVEVAGDELTDRPDEIPVGEVDKGAKTNDAAHGPAFLTINAANTPAAGAKFKLFGEDGSAIHSGVVPASVEVLADSRCKLVINKSGYKPWEDWQAIGARGSSQDVSVRLEEQPPNTVTVSVCAATGKKANQWCPTTTRKDFEKGQEPATCATHKPPPGRVSVKVCAASGKRVNQWCPTAVTKTFDKNRVPGYCTVHSAPANTVTVTACTATGQKANQWCPSTGARTVPANAAPGVCTAHAAPPPPSQPTVQVRTCTASGQKSGPYCPDTSVRNFVKGQAPRKCAMHATPPPKPPTAAQQHKWCPQCNTQNRVNARLCRQCKYRF